MKSTNDNLKFQAEHHELIQTNNFQTIEQYCLHLIHQKAYLEASIFAKDKIVLDLGCNIGYGTNILSNHAKTIFGVDISSNAIQMAKVTYQNSNINFKYFDGNTLPFEDNKFDLIVSFQVIEHIVDYDLYFNEMERVLSPDGIVIFTTPNSKLRIKKGLKPWNPFHVREFTAKELKFLLSLYFSMVEIKGLYAKKELYNIEFNRLKRIKRNHYLKFKKNNPNYFNKFINVLFKKIVNNKKHNSTDPNNYSLNDLYYVNRNLNKSLDFMVICKL